MKTLILKESQAPYAFDEAALAEGPVQVRRVEGGSERVVGVLISPEEYATFRAWQEMQQPHGETPAHQAFEREVKAFERMLPQLLEKQRNWVVAIHDGQVVEVGNSKEDVSERVHQRLGDIVVYVQRVLERPRVYKFPHFKVQQNHGTFERMLPELLAKYRNLVVAIHNDQVVEIGRPGESVAKVAGRVYDRMGYVPVYVQRVTETPQVYKITGPRLVQR